MMDIKDALSAYSEYLDTEGLLDNKPTMTREQMIAAVEGLVLKNTVMPIIIGPVVAAEIVDAILGAAGPKDERTHDDLVKDFIGQTNEGSPLQRYLKEVDNLAYKGKTISGVPITAQHIQARTIDIEQITDGFGVPVTTRRMEDGK